MKLKNSLLVILLSIGVVSLWATSITLVVVDDNTTYIEQHSASQKEYTEKQFWPIKTITEASVMKQDK